MNTEFHLLFSCIGTESYEGLGNSSQLGPVLPSMNNFVTS